jgi:hypothetical protein
VQSEFQTSEYSLEANAAYKFWQTLGTASQLLLALAIEIDQQLVVLLSFLLLGLWASCMRRRRATLRVEEEALVSEEPSIQV